MIFSKLRLLTNMLTILWEGMMPIDQVLWEYVINEKVFSKEFDVQRKDLWRSKKQRYPSIYDGDIVFLTNIETNIEKVTLIVSEIKFSAIMTMFEHKMKTSPNNGSLGFQAIIYNNNRKKIVIGSRSKNSEYKPLYFSVPGGIFEKSDLNGSVKDAIIREINEETNLKIEFESICLRAIVREQNNIAIGLIIECNAETDGSSSILGNEEWESNKLEWLPITKLCNMDECILEGLLYLQSKHC